MTKQQKRKDTKFSSVEKRLNTSMAFTRTIVNTVMGCRPVSSTLITIQPFNITVV